MAIPDNYIDKFTKDGESRMISPAADKVRVDNEHYEGDNLDDVLDEIDDKVSQAGTGNYTKPSTGIPKSDMESAVQASLGKADSAVQGIQINGGLILPKVHNNVDIFVPSRTSQLQNDSGFITADDLPEGVECDSQMSSTSEKPVQNKVIKAYVDNLINGLIDGAPAALDTLKELATALGNNPDVIANIVNTLSSKANADEVVPNTRKVNNKPLSGDVTIGMGDIPGLSDALEHIEAGEQIAFDAGGTAIIDSASSPNADTVLGAASARWVKEIDQNVKAILAALANIAFTTGKPTWQTVAKRKFGLTMTSLTGCTGSVQTGDAGNNQVYEGLVVIRLTPSTGYAFTSISVTKTSGGDAITFERSEASGHTDISFACSEAVTVAAVATEGRSISLSGTNSTHLHLTKSSIPVSTTVYEDTLSADTHWNLPSTIAATVNGVSITFDGTNNSYDSTTGAIKISNINGDIAITANAVEDEFAVLDLDEVGSNVAVKRGSENLLEQETPVHVYKDETISILPVGDNKVSATVTVGGNAVTLGGNAYDGFTYTIQQGDVSSSGTSIAIEAEATALQTFNIVLSGVTSDVGVTWNTPSAAVSTILEGSPFSVTLAKVSGTGVLNISTSTMGSETIQPNNGTIATNHVKGNITIAASVAAAHMKVHSYAYPATSELVGETTEEFIEDTKGDFNLFKYTKGEGGTSGTFSPSSRGGYYPNNSYANGINSDPAYRLGKSAVGDRIIGVEDGGDFTVILKGVKPKIETGPAGYMYDNNQPLFYFVDRPVNTTANQQYFPSLGQFLLSLGSKSSSHSQRYMYPRLDYSNGSIVSSVFYFAADSEHGESIGCISKSVASQTTLDANTSFDMVVTYDAGTKTAKAWIMKTDSNDSPATKTLMYSGEITTSYVLKMPCISLPSNNYVVGLDVYNYAMTENEIAAELDATIAPIPEPAS